MSAYDRQGWQMTIGQCALYKTGGQYWFTPVINGRLNRHCQCENT